MEYNDLPYELIVVLNILATTMLAIYLLLFFITRKQLIGYMRRNFSQENLEKLSLLPKNPSRYAKWGLIFEYALQNDQPLTVKLNRFRRYQLGTSDSFAVWVSLLLFTVWFFKIF